MSKMGQHVQQQVEHGNYTLDRRDKYNVSLEDREEHPSPQDKNTRDSVLGHGTGGQRINKAKGD